MIRTVFSLVALGLALAACSTAGDPAPVISVAGRPAAPIIGGVLAGPLGAALAPEDRQIGYAAQLEALDSGQRRPWKGGNGVYGYIEPAAGVGACRDYTHTIYIGGRPRSGKGAACREPNGAWRNL